MSFVVCRQKGAYLIQNQIATRLTRSSISDELVEIIRQRVNTGALKPGERIFEASLANEFGVSRSPLREALAKLSAEGLLRTELHRGTYVTPIDSTRLRQLLEFRLVLEEFAVRRIVENDGARNLERLDEALDAIDAATHLSDLNAMSEASLRFHELLIELSGNQPLSTAYRALLNELRLYIRTTLQYYQSPRELRTELEAFLAAVREQRIEDAIQLLRRHIEHGFKDALEKIS